MSTGSGIKAHWGFSDYTLEGDAAHTLAVNTGNGNLVVTATDKAFPARIPAVLMRTYNSQNSAVSGMLGKGWMFSFEESVRKVSGDYLYTDTTGAEYTWTVDMGPPVTYTRPAGVFSDLTVVSGEVIITMPNGFKRIFDEMKGHLLRYEDTNGNKLNFTRNPSDEIVSIDSETGGSTTILVTFRYTAGLCTEFAQDPLTGPKWVFTYGSGLLETVTDPISPTGQKWTYEYTSGVLNKIKDPRWALLENVNAEVAYTSSQVTQITDVDLNTIDFSYLTNYTNVSDRLSNTTKMTYASGTLALTQIELPLPYTPPALPKTIDFVWTNLTLTKVTDALGRDTDYEYDTNGNLDKITKDDAGTPRVTDLLYNTTYNTLTNVTTPESHVTAFTYDTARNLTSIQLPVEVAASSSIKQTFAYESNGDLTTVTDQVGHQQEFSYDETYGVVTESSLINSDTKAFYTTYYTYGTAAQTVTQAVNPAKVIQDFVYDNLGRVTEAKSYPDSSTTLKTTYTYDACGNVTRVRPPKGNAGTPVDDYDVDYTYDKLNNLATALLPETTTDFTYEYGYDNNENLVSYKQHLDGGTSFETTYTYDEVNRLLTTTLPPIEPTPPPSLSVYTLTYDAVGNVLTSTDAMSKTTTYTYNYLNQVLTEEGPIDDLKFGYTYDNDGRLTEIIGQPGDLPIPYLARKYVYIYNDNGWLTSLQDPLYDKDTNDVETKYEYYANGQLMNVQLPLQDQQKTTYSRTYYYESTGWLMTVADALGSGATYNYRNDGKVSTQVDAEGHLTSYEYDDAGRNTRINYAVGMDGGPKDPDNAPHAAFVYDENSNITTLTGPDGFRTVYTYDDRDRLTKMTRHDDVPTTSSFDIDYTYDQLNRKVSTLSQRLSKNEFTYDAHGRLTLKVIDVTQGPYTGFNYDYEYEYDLNGRLTRQVDPDENDIQYEYDELGRVTKKTDEIGGEIVNTYDLWGNLTKQVWQDGTADTYEYDELQRLTRQTNALGQYFEYEYDANGNNIKLTAPWSAVTDFSYNLRSELIGVISKDPTADDPREQIEIFSYTPNGRLSSYNGPKGEYWTYEYDGMGRWTKLEDTNGNSAERTYNGSNTLATSRGVMGGNFSMAYNGYRKRTSTTAIGEEPNNVTDYTWVDIDLEKVEEPGGISRTTTTFTRDRLGRITEASRTEDGITFEDTEYTYNWRSQILVRTLPSSAGTETFTYDARGLLQQVDYTNPTGQITLEYDARGRQVLVSFPNGVSRFFNYNQAGRMVADILQDAGGYVFMTYYSYDKHGRRVVNILDRKFISGSTPPPIFTPQNNEGNPVIPTGSGTSQADIDGYSVKTYPSETWIDGTKETSHTIYHLKVISVGTPDEKVYAEDSSNNKVGIQANITRNVGGNYVLIDLLPDPWDTSQSSTQISGQWTVTPTEYSSSNLLKDTSPAYNYANQVIQESLDETGSSITTDDYDLGTECMGKNAISSSGSAVASEKSARGMVKQEMTFDNALKTSGSGSMNEIPEPWNDMIGTGTGETKLGIIYMNPYTGEIFTDKAAYDESIRKYYSKFFGRLDKITIYDHVGATEETQAEFSYDSYGRLVGAIDRTQNPAVTKSYHNDWPTGNMNLESDGTTTRTHNHGPGWTRDNKDISGWEIEDWIHNGPWGNGKWGVGEDGYIKRYYGYSTFGNNIMEETFNGAGSQSPGSIGGQTRPIDSYDQLTVGNSESRDNTPMVGALDSPAASGAKAGGNSGNPDTAFGYSPGAQQQQDKWIRERDKWLRDSVAESIRNGISGHVSDGGSHNGWSIGDGNGNWTGPAVLPGDNKPGFGFPDAPPNAPNDQQDQSTQADMRMAGTFGEQEYYGAKPGKQTGAILVDDGRSTRQPLPSAPPPGGQGGPIGFGYGGRSRPPIKDWGDIEGNGPWFQDPPGPWPLMPNEDSGGDQNSGVPDRGSQTRRKIKSNKQLVNELIDEIDEEKEPSEETKEGAEDIQNEDIKNASEPPPNEVVDDYVDVYTGITEIVTGFGVDDLVVGGIGLVVKNRRVSGALLKRAGDASKYIPSRMGSRLTNKRAVTDGVRKTYNKAKRGGLGRKVNETAGAAKNQDAVDAGMEFVDIKHGATPIPGKGKQKGEIIGYKSADGTRIFRLPNWKEGDEAYKANYEYWGNGKDNVWGRQANIHVWIVN